MTTKTATEKIIFIEYQHGRPFCVVTEAPSTGDRGGVVHEEYALERCRRDGTLYWHNIGGGGHGPLSTSDTSVFWAAAHVVFREYDRETKGYDILEAPKGTRLARSKGRRQLHKAIVLGKWVRGIDGDVSTEYCSVCRDYLPNGDSDRLCEHVWYCFESSNWSTPGNRCPWDCAQCVAEGREVGEPPPWARVAQGYGMAASRLRTVALRIAKAHQITFDRVREWFPCKAFQEGFTAALQGVAHRKADQGQVDRFAMIFDLTREERQELTAAFGFDRRKKGA